MFLDRLEAGLLLLQTPQGLVPVEPTLWQRIYLIWTFRNFRRLSLPLLNPRQIRLINTLAHGGAGVVRDSYDWSLVIGVIENFVPPVSPARDEPSEHEGGQTANTGVEVSPRLPVFLRPRPSYGFFARWKALKLPRVRVSPAWVKTGAAAFCLCLILAVVWQRIQAIPSSNAHNGPRPEERSPIGASVSNSPAPRLSAPAVPAERWTPTVPIVAAAAAREVIVQAPSATPSASVSRAVKPAASIAVLAPKGNKIRNDIRASNSALSTSLQRGVLEDTVQATRPPLRFEYPSHLDIRARADVALTAILDSDGTVRAVKVVRGDRALAADAVRAVRKWRYRPFLKGGQSVPTETNIVISFFPGDAISISYPRSLDVSR